MIGTLRGVVAAAFTTHRGGALGAAARFTGEGRFSRRGRSYTDGLEPAEARFLQDVADDVVASEGA